MALVRRPPCILGVGKNYQDHVNELGGERPQQAVVFFKNPASVIGNGERWILRAAGRSAPFQGSW